LFLRNLDEEYQINIYRGIRTQAHTRGVELVCVQGETLQPGEDRIGPFALAREVRFDGLLVLSSVIVDTDRPRSASTIPRRLPPVPAVSIGLKVPGMVSLTLQSNRSLAQVIDHLVLTHGCRRFLYIGGPKLHPDNRIRERVFRETLDRHATHREGIEGVIDHGGFFDVSGMMVIRRHLDGQPFDAVVAANDNMALGVQRVLATQENPRWSRCAVTGFDDISQCRVCSPPLTTVHAPLEELGSRALEVLVDLIEGRATPRSLTIPTYPVFRGSCGCQDWEGAPRPPEPDGTRLEVRFEEVRRRILEGDQWLREGNDFGREMGAVTNRQALVDRLDDFLTLLRVRHFFLVIDETLWNERRDGKKVSLPPEGKPAPGGTRFLFPDAPTEVSRDLCLYHLVSESVPLGIAVYSVDDQSLPHLTAALPHVAHAIQRIRNQAEQETRLKEEVRLRRIAEAEVLKVSEFERQRFGLDLHDDICQRLAGLTMYIRGIGKNPPSDPGPVWKELGQMVDETLLLTRQYAHASFPIDLDTRGLAPVLRTLCETVSKQKGIVCEFSSQAGAPAHRALEVRGLAALHLFRIVQEALQNAIKHSGATRISVTLKGTDRLVLEVVDNGRGLGARPSALGGMGLRSMAYRASQLGSELELESTPQTGTVVRVVLHQ
jgi:signal transduction histidine kinase/DNA-binding LacI/PurR family transcriptional regulator